MCDINILDHDYYKREDQSSLINLDNTFADIVKHSAIMCNLRHFFVSRDQKNNITPRINVKMLKINFFQTKSLNQSIHKWRSALLDYESRCNFCKQAGRTYSQYNCGNSENICIMGKLMMSHETRGSLWCHFGIWITFSWVQRYFE